MEPAEVVEPGDEEEERFGTPEEGEGGGEEGEKLEKEEEREEGVEEGEKEGEERVEEGEEGEAGDLEGAVDQLTLDEDQDIESPAYIPKTGKYVVSVAVIYYFNHFHFTFALDTMIIISRVTYSKLS